MTENRKYNIAEADEQLLRQFFEANAPAVDDNGFTERVMSRLPVRQGSLRWVSRLWTVTCVALAALVFWLLNGWAEVSTGLSHLLGNGIGLLYDLLTLLSSASMTSLYTATVALFLLVMMGARELRVKS